MEKRSKNFDDIFKNKLSGLSADSNPSDWIMMERLLEMEGLTQEHEATDETLFDEVALDKLNNIPTADLVPDWDRMSSMIDDMNEEPSMEPSEFDQAINNKIKHTTAPLETAVWSRIEPILDRDRAAVVEDLDAVAKGKLTQISEIEPAWGSMNSKINRELFLPESIVKYKVIEVALILLFAFSASQLPVEKITDQITNKESFTSTLIEPLVSDPVAVESIDKSVKKDITPTEAIVSTQIEFLDTPNSDITTSSDIILSSPSENLTISEEALDTDQVALVEESIWDLPPTLVEALDEFSTSPSFRFTPEAYVYLFQPKNIDGYENAIAFLDLYDQQLLFNVFGRQENVFGLSSDPKSEDRIIDDLAISDATETPLLSETLSPSPLVEVETGSLRNNSGLILSMFTGSDYNEIVTPFDPVYAKEGTQQWNIGYAGGLSLGMRFKNWELETGAIYASNQYQPRKLYEYTGSLATGYISSTLKDIELEVVKIPLNFRFNVNLWDKWKVYALSGATMNMVVQSEFITDDVLVVKGSFASPANPSAQNTGLSRKDFGEGILEGGSFKDNSYFTANLGFGVERTLNNKWSVFAQPTYQRQIFSNGIGPNQDRYNAISLFLGTRVALSKKVKK